MNILTVNLLFSTLVFWLAARLYVLPRLHELAPRTVVLPILLLHAFRHLGLMFLASGATYPGMPPAFAYPAAFGDLLAALLAIVAVPAVAKQVRSARSLVWLFNVAGTLDLLHGTSILDSGLLGSRPAGDACHHVHCPAHILDSVYLTVPFPVTSRRVVVACKCRDCGAGA